MKKKRAQADGGADLSEDEDEDDEEESGDEDDEDVPQDDEEEEGRDEDVDDDGEVDEDREEWDVEVAEAMRTQVFESLSLNTEALRVRLVALIRICKLAHRIHYSSILRHTLHQLCEQTKVPVKILSHAIITRWNSVTITLGAALEIRPALTLLIGTSKYKLSRLTLSDDHWTFVEEIYPILEVCFAFKLHRFGLLD